MVRDRERQVQKLESLQLLPLPLKQLVAPPHVFRRVQIVLV